MVRLLTTVLGFLLLLAWMFTGTQPGRPPAPEGRGGASRAEPEMMHLARPEADRAGGQPQTIGNGNAKVVIPRSADGHFYVDAQVGPATIHFLVDTGATAVALSKADAQRAGIAPAPGDYSGEALTANGSVKVKPVMIDRIRIGALEATGVEGAVIDGDLGVSLLGQSWLRRVGSVTISGDQLVLN